MEVSRLQTQIPFFFEHPQHGFTVVHLGNDPVKLRYLGLRGGEDLEGLELWCSHVPRLFEREDTK